MLGDRFKNLQLVEGSLFHFSIDRIYDNNKILGLLSILVFPYDESQQIEETPMANWIIYAITAYFTLLIVLFGIKSFLPSSPDSLN
jgi:hypothetical protein